MIKLDRIAYIKRLESLVRSGLVTDAINIHTTVTLSAIDDGPILEVILNCLRQAENGDAESFYTLIAGILEGTR